MADFMRSGDNANHGGVFRAAEATDELTHAAREAVGRFLGGTPDTVAFGPSMTAMTMRFSAAVGRTLSAGDEIVCTRLDHDGNVAPWLIAAERAGATVRFADPDPETLELPASAIEAVLTDRTRWVAVTAASNAVGTVPELPGIVATAHDAGALVYLDAVHAAPHRPLDVEALGCDALACSAYKWFGPHVGILWGRPEVLEPLRPDKLRPSPDELPDRFELGTLPFEALAGVRAAAEFMLGLDRDALRAHEDALLAQMLDGLRAIDGVTVYGAARDRAPTVMFTVDGRTSLEVARALAGSPRFLLLDEPAAGMNEAESDQLRASIERIRSEQKCGILVVDHDLRLIMQLCDTIYVLNEGKMISRGTPEEVRSDPAVIAAYIGEEERNVDPKGSGE
jgi:cysteine desulfurase family protein (TIGR01976 family)